MLNLSPFEMFGALVVAHMICDYPLQGDFLAKAKNHTAPIPGVPWWQALGAHSIIHGGAVWLITGVWWLGLLETAAHAITDFAKCSRHINFTGDQLMHVGFKVIWVGLTLSFGEGLFAVVIPACAITATLIIPGPFAEEPA